MALVAYDYDSGSENEEDEDTSSTVVIPEKPQIGNNDDDDNSEDVSTNPNNPITQLLSDLPKSKSEENRDIIEDKLEDFIPKYQPQTKEKHQKVKITIPSLSEFNEIDDDDDEPANKKSKPSSKGSSLLAILPPVKGTPLSTKSFIPNTLMNKPTTQKTSTSSTTTSLVPNNVRKKAELAKKAAIEKATRKTTISNNPVESDDDDIEMPETFDDEMWHKVCGRPKKQQQQQKIVETNVEEQQEQAQINLAPEPEKPYDGLDNAAFKEFIGKTKRPVNIKLVDLNEEEILSEKDVWMTKALTDPENEPKPEVEEPVDPTRRKKHHITYLAQQAKVNEQTFKNQWAASKFTRNQTRAKYGF